MMNDPASLPNWGESSNAARSIAGNRAAVGTGGSRGNGLTGIPLAMVYSPNQIWGAIYDPSLALQRGTLFPELDKPWVGEEVDRDD